MNSYGINFQRYVEPLLALVGSKYVWGGANIGAVDCSGTLRYMFARNCHFLTYTADKFFKEVFTEPCEPEDELNPEILKAVFYITKVPYETPDGDIRPAGIVRHVAPVVGDYVVLHADFQRGVVLKSAKSVRLLYEAKNCKAVWRKMK